MIKEKIMTDADEVRTLEVRKDNWAQTRIVRAPLDTDLDTNEVLFRIDRLALTANNISYASSGDALAYWEFFPTEDGWGRIPAMGWADVIVSKHPDVQVGERVWGFFPYATHVKITAGKVDSVGFKDVSEHRANHSPIYVQFDRASTFPVYEQAREDQDILLRGLFATSWLVEDFIETNNLFGAQDCLITSASSKTSIALAHAIKQRGKLVSLGITSPSKVAFCESLGCYDRVITYEEITNLDANRPAVMVDMAGSAKVIATVHRHLMDNMVYSCRIGATHHDQMGSTKGLPGAKPQFFFAPTHMQQRSKEMGRKEYSALLLSAYAKFRTFCDDWMTVNRTYGENSVTDIYQLVLKGQADPTIGQIVSLWQESSSGD